MKKILAILNGDLRLLAGQEALDLGEQADLGRGRDMSSRRLSGRIQADPDLQPVPPLDVAASASDAIWRAAIIGCRSANK